MIFRNSLDLSYVLVMWFVGKGESWSVYRKTTAARPSNRFTATSINLGMALTDYLENDLVAISFNKDESPRLCAVKPDGGVAPLCIREDDVETDLFADPREYANYFWDNVTEEEVTGDFGEGFYGQRPVPSLGGGPGYGADALEIWSVTEELLEAVRGKGVDVPVLDVGIAHGEKARGGSF